MEHENEHETRRDNERDNERDKGRDTKGEPAVDGSEQERYELMVERGYVRSHTAYALGVYILAAFICLGMIFAIFYLADGQLPVLAFIALGPALATGVLFVVSRHLKKKISRAMATQRERS